MSGLSPSSLPSTAVTTPRASRRTADEVVGAPATDGPAVSAAARSDVRLEAILRSQFDAVWRALRRFGVPENSTDDAAQEVFIIASRRLEEVTLGHERRFLFGVALRVAANVRRAQAVRRAHSGDGVLLEVSSEVPTPDILLDQKRMRELLDRILDRMSDELREAFVLHELEGFSAPEIAELCGIPVGTVASRLRRAREEFQLAATRFKDSIYRPRGAP